MLINGLNQLRFFTHTDGGRPQYLNGSQVFDRAVERHYSSEQFTITTIADGGMCKGSELTFSGTIGDSNIYILSDNHHDIPFGSVLNDWLPCQAITNSDYDLFYGSDMEDNVLDSLMPIIDASGNEVLNSLGAIVYGALQSTGNTGSAASLSTLQVSFVALQYNPATKTHAFVEAVIPSGVYTMNASGMYSFIQARRYSNCPIGGTIARVNLDSKASVEEVIELIKKSTRRKVEVGFTVGASLELDKVLFHLPLAAGDILVSSDIDGTVADLATQPTNTSAIYGGAIDGNHIVANAALAMQNEALVVKYNGVLASVFNAEIDSVVIAVGQPAELVVSLTPPSGMILVGDEIEIAYIPVPA